MGRVGPKMKLRPTHLKMGFDRALACRAELEVGLEPRAFWRPLFIPNLFAHERAYLSSSYSQIFVTLIFIIFIHLKLTIYIYIYIYMIKVEFVPRILYQFCKKNKLYFLTI